MLGGGLSSRGARPLLCHFGHIGDMNDPFAAQQPWRRRSWHRFERPSQQLRQRVGQAALCDGAEFPSDLELETAEIGPAQPVSLLEYGVEHRGEVAGRGVDNLQYLSGRGLLL